MATAAGECLPKWSAREHSCTEQDKEHTRGNRWGQKERESKRAIEGKHWLVVAGKKALKSLGPNGRVFSLLVYCLSLLESTSNFFFLKRDKNQ